ncbi:MAG: hypothetical protein HQM13_19705, partial [SAR324 cluster bacterium]|nr:hypothetical protein [SAR324 cluster bacterium]
KPDFLPARINLVSTLFISGHFDEALAGGQAVLKDNPNEYRMLYIVGEILLRKGDKENANKYFSKVSKIAPDFKQVRKHLSEQ